MKNKKINYLLISGVAIVWGLIFYKIYDSMSATDLPIADFKTPKEAYFKDVNHEDDSVSLDLDYRNPFAASVLADEAIVPVGDPIGTKKAIPAFKPVVNWSGITYNGYVRNATTKQKIIMITINGKEQMLVEGQSVGGIKLLKYAGDSVKIAYQNETKYLKIK